MLQWEGPGEGSKTTPRRCTDGSPGVGFNGVDPVRGRRPIQTIAWLLQKSSFNAVDPVRGRRLPCRRFAKSYAKIHASARGAVSPLLSSSPLEVVRNLNGPVGPLRSRIRRITRKPSINRRSEPRALPAARPVAVAGPARSSLSPRTVPAYVRASIQWRSLDRSRFPQARPHGCSRPLISTA